MKYKIVIVNFRDEACDISALAPNACYCDIDRQNISNYEQWVVLELYGVHIFETDDLETFDLMEAQKQKDKEKEHCVMFGGGRQGGKTWANAQFLKHFEEKQVAQNKDFRKSEIRRIAEQLLIEIMNIRTDLADIKVCIKLAKDFVDKFDAEFERLEGK